jgi:hypothetical protein
MANKATMSELVEIVVLGVITIAVGAGCVHVIFLLLQYLYQMLH